MCPPTDCKRNYQADLNDAVQIQSTLETTKSVKQYELGLHQLITKTFS